MYPLIDTAFLYDNLPQYILLSILFILFSVFLYIKLAFPFWNIQPVYHVYDFWRCLYRNPFKIYNRFHPKVRTKYCKPDLVNTIRFVDASQETKKEFVNLLQCYSLADENAIYMFHLDNLEAYFGGHLSCSYLSFYTEVLYKSVNGEVIKESVPKGCISSRSGVLIAGGHKENIYYIDFMTTVRGLASTVSLKITRELFDTHIYNVGVNEWRDSLYVKNDVRVDPIGVGLFKRMGFNLDGIVPLVRFTTRSYEIPNNPGFYKGIRYPEHVVLTEISSSCLRKMTDGLEISCRKFAIYGTTDIANLIGLIKAGVLYVYVLERLGDILAMYFFRDTRIRYEGSTERDTGAVLELAGSIYISGSVGLFQNGFMGALYDILKGKPVYRRIQIDDISDNGGLDMRELYFLGEEKGGYYLFNFVVPVSCSPGGCFLLF
jgi:hypothetical protein